MTYEQSVALGITLLLLTCACGGGGASDSSPTAPDNPPTDPTPGSPNSLASLSGDQQTGTVDTDLSDPIVATVVDAEGQAVPNTTVSWEVTAGGGSVFASATSSNEDGQTQNVWTLGTVAGEQELEVRWVDPSTGDALVLGSFTATAEPGPAASLTLESPSPSILNVAESFQVIVSGEDEFGNSISPEDVDANWSTADASIAEVDGSGLVTAVGGGSTTVEANANGASVSTTVLVNAFETTIYPHSGEYPFDIAESGDRFVSVFLGDPKTVREFVNDEWILSRTGYNFDNVAGLGSGEFLLIEGQPVSGGVDAVVMYSAGSGSWSEDYRTNDWSGPAFATHVDGSMVVYTEAPEVWMRDVAGSWQNLEHPVSKNGRSLWGNTGHFLASNEVYWCGLSDPDSGLRSPEASYWDGTSWTFLSYAGFTEGSQDPPLHCTGTDKQAGLGYGIIRRRDGPTEVIQLSGGAVSSVPFVDAVTTEYLTEISVMPNGELLLTFDDPRNEVPLDPNLQMQGSDGSWTPYWLPDRWDVSGKPLIDSQGRIWFGAYKRHSDEGATYVLTP